MSELLLRSRDYTVIVAKTASNSAALAPGFETRWLDAQAAILALLQKCQEYDPDGITLYISSKDYQAADFRCYRQVTAEQLGAIFEQNYPPAALDLRSGLQIALDDYFERREKRQTKSNGEIMIVLIDGEPLDRMAIVRTIVAATHRMDVDCELGIGFVQVGNDLIARGFLEALDENLRGAVGARFDIVNTRVLQEIQPNCLTEFLLDILRD